MASFLIVRDNRAESDVTSESILERILFCPWYVAAKGMIHAAEAAEEAQAWLPYTQFTSKLRQWML